MPAMAFAIFRRRMLPDMRKHRMRIHLRKHILDCKTCA